MFLNIATEIARLINLCTAGYHIMNMLATSSLNNYLHAFHIRLFYILIEKAKKKLDKNIQIARI